MNQSVDTHANLFIECVYGALIKDEHSQQSTSHAAEDPVPQPLLDTRQPLHSSPLPNARLISTAAIATSGDHSVQVTVTGEPWWTDGHLQAQAQQQGHAAVVLEGYQRAGEKFLSDIAGSFSVIVVDTAKQTLLAAVDKLGRYPLYYRQSAAGIHVSSQIPALAKDLLAAGQNRQGAEHSSSFDISNQGIYNYIYFHMIPAPQSVYEGVHKLQAAHRLLVSANTLSVKRYWTPVFSEAPRRSMYDYGRELKRVLGKAVERALHQNPQTGAFLSGGLDSSTVAGVMAEHGGGPVFSIGFSAEGYDEMAYARITARHFGLELHEYYVTPEDVVTALPLIAASYDEPFGNSSALPAYFCAQMAARHGVGALLAGDGGDELFAGNARYAKQSLFEHYLRVPGTIRQTAIEPALSCFPDSTPLIAKLKSYVRQANTPLPGRLHTYNFLHQFNPAELFTADFLRGIDPRQPGRDQEEVFHAPQDASYVNRMLYLDWQYTLADNDLRKVSQMCALAGVKVLYPMIDDELIELSCQIPSQWKLKGSLLDSNAGLRHFYKKSLTGWLPQETIDKRKQGFGLPFGVWMRTHKPLQELAYDALSELKKYDIFQPQFLDQAVRLHRDGHAAYYGELVWILMVLQLWLSQRRQASSLERAA